MKRRRKSRVFAPRVLHTRADFVVDVSSSMASGGGAPGAVSRIEALKKQMHDSVSALSEESQFAIIFFNDGFWGIDGKPNSKGCIRWTQATDKNKFKALRRIRAARAEGGTSWVAPLAAAVKLNPKPEVLYLLSDGEPSD